MRLVSVADKIHNSRCILSDLRVRGEEAVWKKFTGGKEGTFWYYRELLARYDAAGPAPLAEELGRIVREIEAIARREHPGHNS